MAYREEISVPPPRSFQPRRNRGTLSTMTLTPTGAAGMKWWMIWATPVMPPKAMPLGA